MKEIFSTHGSPPKMGFARWREAINDRFVPCDCSVEDRERFSGSIHAARIGDLTVTRTSMGAMRNEVRGATMRRFKGDVLMLTAVLSGRNIRQQDDREVILNPGDFTVYDGRSSVFKVEDDTTILSIEVSRNRFQAALGPSRIYSALAVGSAQAGTTLAINFLRELVSVEALLDSTMQTRMASIAQDLLIAAVAERIAKNPPTSIQGDVIVQRAKAYATSHLGDPRLDSGKVAAASGVSLRRLQELFSERGRGIAEWIWDKRLSMAAGRLDDLSLVYRSIGDIAFTCGFENPSHFSTRFKARFGLTPRDYRAQAIQAAITSDSTS